MEREPPLKELKDFYRVYDKPPKILRIGFCVNCERMREVNDQSKCMNCGSSSVLVKGRKK